MMDGGEKKTALFQTMVDTACEGLTQVDARAKIERLRQMEQTLKELEQELTEILESRSRKEDCKDEAKVER
ncbi:hypothetical protein [Treponema sp. J25]|uniref:hypothetical protein n=1 Tax=Treponema sp. J25 TaxID=2094121 RepID=UPI001048F099|nr:hypothetical protein [Treponema sp. J25]TCW62655.1 hypothetical protein C5O22_00960 [Treponema sp. J25]